MLGHGSPGTCQVGVTSERSRRDADYQAGTLPRGVLVCVFVADLTLREAEAFLEDEIKSWR